MPKRDEISNRFDESGNYMDQLQDEGLMTQEDKEVQQEPANDDLKDVKEGQDPDSQKEDAKAAHKHEAKFDRSQIELDIPVEELHKEAEPEPQQVESTEVVYVPRKDFGARINQTEFEFKKGQRTRVSRDLAALLLEDEDRGYVIEEL